MCKRAYCLVRISWQPHFFCYVCCNRGKGIRAVRHYTVDIQSSCLSKHSLFIHNIHLAVFISHLMPGIILMQVGTNDIVALSLCLKGSFHLHDIATQNHKFTTPYPPKGEFFVSIVAIRQSLSIFYAFVFFHYAVFYLKYYQNPSPIWGNGALPVLKFISYTYTCNTLLADTQFGKTAKIRTTSFYTDKRSLKVEFIFCREFICRTICICICR